MIKLVRDTAVARRGLTRRKFSVLEGGSRADSSRHAGVLRVSRTCRPCGRVARISTTR